jgi:hypothetical protein
VKRPPRARPKRRSTYALRLARKRIAKLRHGYDRVFGIGETKTGTSSFGASMELLGFRRHVGWDYGLYRSGLDGDLAPILDVAQRYEVFEDLPWGGGDLYRVLADRFPKARFVLTIRDVASWSVSHERHWGPRSTIPEVLRIPDYADRRDEIVAAYTRRNDDIRAFFAEQPGRLLVLDVVGGDGWAQLCPFLGLPVPAEPFPVVNAGPEVW